MLLQRLALRAAVACALWSASPPAHAFEGKVSFYGAENGQGRRNTACGVRFRPRGLTAAHRSLPCWTRIRVTDLATGRTVDVTVNDRGPAHWTGRVLDLAEGAGDVLGMRARGVIRARVDILGRGRTHLAEE